MYLLMGSGTDYARYCSLLNEICGEPCEPKLNNDGQCLNNVYIVMYTVYFVMFYTIYKVKRVQESLFCIISVCTDRDFNFQIGVNK